MADVTVYGFPISTYVNVGDYVLTGSKAGLYFLITFVIGLLYWVVLVGRTGWSPGKAMLGLRVVKEEDGSTPILVEVRVNDVPVPSHAWNGSTYPVPPAELITAAIQDEIDRMGPRPGQGSPRPSVSGSRR